MAGEGLRSQRGDCRARKSVDKVRPNCLGQALGVSHHVPEQARSEGKGFCEDIHAMTHTPRASTPLTKDSSRNWVDSSL